MHAFRGKGQENEGEHPVALQVEPVAFPQGKHREDLEYLKAVEGTLGEWEGEADVASPKGEHRVEAYREL